MKALLTKALPFVATCVAAVAIAALVIGVGRGGESSAPGRFEARIPPVEFLYLDGPRILQYLAELEGGEVGAVSRISKEIHSLDTGAEGGGFKVGASAQREDSTQSTLVRTESSELGLLLAGLEDDDRPGVSYHSIDLEKSADLTAVKEGMLVKFVTHSLLSPGYIRPYVVVRQSATLAALFPRAAGSSADAEHSEIQRRKAESFARQIGPNPRLTFAVEPPKRHGEKPLTLLLPMQYRDLTQERSLLERGRDQYTGGKLVVIGKVIRVFPHPTHLDCGAVRGICETGSGPEYTDFATREIWRNPLEQASSYLIDEVSHSCIAERSLAELNERPPNSSPLIKGRACFLQKLRAQTELEAPGAVILPLAIYK